MNCTYKERKEIIINNERCIDCAEKNEKKREYKICSIASQ